MTTKTFQVLRSAILSLLLLGLAVIPAAANDVDITFNIDCYDGDLSKTGSSDSITVEFWGDGVLLGSQMKEPDCGEWADAEYTTSISEAKAATFDRVKVITSGDNALWIDEAYITSSVEIGHDFDVCDDDGDCHWGRDGGKGWCSSTDNDDWDSAWSSYVDTSVGCRSCFDFKVADGTYTCD